MSKFGRRGTRYEISTVSRDPRLQLVKGDPYGTLSYTGIPVPGAPPTTSSSKTRYLFLLAAAQFNANQFARLVGIRQMAMIGQLVANDEDSTNYPIERPIVTPTWRFTDANISWHLRRYDIQPNANQNVNSRSGVAFRNSGNAALLFEHADTEAGGYKPPNGGAPPGNVVIPDLGNFHDIRFPWNDDSAWSSLDVEIEGPCTIGLFCSVQQSNPTSRVKLALTSPPLGGFECLNPEDAFLLNFPNSVYTRVAGALVFEHAPFLKDRSNPKPWCGTPCDLAEAPIAPIAPIAPPRTSRKGDR